VAVWSNRVLILLGALGMFITGVLSYSALYGLQVPCGGKMGCAIVQQSPFSKFPAETGMPVAYLGFLGYMFLFVLALARTMAHGRTHRRLAVLGFAFSVLGTLFSLYLTYISLALIGQKCSWCLASLAVMLLTTIAYAALLQDEAPSEARDEAKVGALAGLVLLGGAFGAGYATVKDLEGTIDVATELIEADALPMEEVVPVDAKTMGPDDAKVVLVEFLDVNCGTCRQTYPLVKEAVEEAGPSVKLALRHFPLVTTPGHETSSPAAAIAEYAADRGRFWQFMDEVMKPTNQERITTVEGLVAVAGEAGLNRQDIQTVFLSDEPEHVEIAKKYWDRVDADMNLGLKLKIASTPSFLLYGKGREAKAVATHNLKRELDSEPYKSLARGD
jgi:protein-disulfide isomerase